MTLEDVGVAGVGAVPGAGLTALGGGGTFVGAAELCDPGRNAGSELRIEVSLELEGPFRMSAKDRWDGKSRQYSTQVSITP